MDKWNFLGLIFFQSLMHHFFGLEEVHEKKTIIRKQTICELLSRYLLLSYICSNQDCRWWQRGTQSVAKASILSCNNYNNHNNFKISLKILFLYDHITVANRKSYEIFLWIKAFKLIELQLLSSQLNSYLWYNFMIGNSFYQKTLSVTLYYGCCLTVMHKITFCR